MSVRHVSETLSLTPLPSTVSRRYCYSQRRFIFKLWSQRYLTFDTGLYYNFVSNQCISPTSEDTMSAPHVSETLSLTPSSTVSCRYCYSERRFIFKLRSFGQSVVASVLLSLGGVHCVHGLRTVSKHL